MLARGYVSFRLLFPLLHQLGPRLRLPLLLPSSSSLFFFLLPSSSSFFFLLPVSTSLLLLHACINLLAFGKVKEHERSRGFEYDWVIRARPDISYRQLVQLPGPATGLVRSGCPRLPRCLVASLSRLSLAALTV